MAGQLLQVLLRLKGKKYHRIQIAARFRLIDLLKQISRDLHLSIDQLLHVSIYRRSSGARSLIYPFNKNYPNSSYDASMPLDTYGLSNGEELYIDLSDLMPCGDESDDDDTDLTPINPKASSSSSMQSTTSKNSLNNLELGQLSRYSVPADNSCLFTSIYFVLHSGKFDLSSNKYLRDLVAKRIESDQATYSEAILGKTNTDYCQWIRRGK